MRRGKKTERNNNTYNVFLPFLFHILMHGNVKEMTKAAERELFVNVSRDELYDTYFNVNSFRN